VPQAVVVRSGYRIMIDATNICVGDVLLLNSNMETLVDCVVIAAGDLMVDQSGMTGESDRVPKQRGSVVFAGCTIQSGRYRSKIYNREHQLKQQALLGY
jgi:cation-transporting ATPase E